MTTQTVHFSIGEDFGKTITDVAQEHLLYNYDYKAAKKMIIEGLAGITEEQALDVIFGEFVLKVNVKNQDLSLRKHSKAYKDKGFDKINLIKWVGDSLDNFRGDANGIYNSIYRNAYKFQKNVKISFKIPELLKLESRNIDINDLRYDNEDVDIIFTLVEEAEKVLNGFCKFQKCIGQLILDAKKYKNKEFLKFRWNGEPDIIARLAFAYNGIITGTSFGLIGVPDESLILDNYLNAQKDIDDNLKGGIKPIDHKTGKCSAGWISPEGKYYALNGEISNMLHNQIADAMYDAGIIPNYEEYNNNHDQYLCENGWVKQHDNWILTDGYFKMYDKPMTKEQKKVVYEIGQLHYRGMLLVGLERKPMSAVMFRDVSDDYLRRKYFTL